MSVKWGPPPFREFVDANKKDFILFQLEVSLKDAAGDSAKKAGVVKTRSQKRSPKSIRLKNFTKTTGLYPAMFRSVED